MVSTYPMGSKYFEAIPLGNGGYNGSLYCSSNCFGNICVKVWFTCNRDVLHRPVPGREVQRPPNYLKHHPGRDHNVAGAGQNKASGAVMPPALPKTMCTGGGLWLWSIGRVFQ